MMVTKTSSTIPQITIQMSAIVQYCSS